MTDRSALPTYGSRAEAREALGIVNVHQATVGALRKAILAGEIIAGDSVTELEVVEAYGASRQIARSAVTAVVGIGILRQLPSRTAYVPLFTKRELNDLVSVRIPVEGYGLGSAPGLENGYQQGIGSLRVIQHQLRDLPVEGESADQQAIALELDFHRRLVSMSGSVALGRAFESYADCLQLAYTQHPGTFDRQHLHSGHEALLSEAETTDPDRWTEGFQNAMLDHLSVFEHLTFG